MASCSSTSPSTVECPELFLLEVVAVQSSVLVTVLFGFKSLTATGRAGLDQGQVSVLIQRGMNLRRCLWQQQLQNTLQSDSWVLSSSGLKVWTKFGCWLNRHLDIQQQISERSAAQAILKSSAQVRMVEQYLASRKIILLKLAPRLIRFRRAQHLAWLSSWWRKSTMAVRFWRYKWYGISSSLISTSSNPLLLLSTHFIRINPSSFSASLRSIWSLTIRLLSKISTLKNLSQPSGLASSDCRHTMNLDTVFYLTWPTIQTKYFSSLCSAFRSFLIAF